MCECMYTLMLVASLMLSTLRTEEGPLAEFGTGYFSQFALGSPCSHLPHSWITGGQPNPLRLYCKFWVSKFLSSCFSRKYFTH